VRVLHYISRAPLVGYDPRSNPYRTHTIRLAAGACGNIDRRPVVEFLEAAGLTRRGRVRSVLARMLAREKVLDLRHAVAGALGDSQ
jgi:hypothetical protein